MTENEYLNLNGWRLIGKKNVPTSVYFWDHPAHQPNKHGAFTQSRAIEHQKMLDKGWRCHCIGDKDA